MSKWLSDLKEGQKGERVIADYICEKRNYGVVEFRDDSQYDFKLSSDTKSTITFEVKTDRWEHFKKCKTWNMFIELNCNGKDSGIVASKADYFVYYFPDHEIAYIIGRDNLLKLIEENEFQVSTQAGDGGRVTGVLIHRNLHKKSFHTIKIEKDGDIWLN